MNNITYYLLYLKYLLQSTAYLSLISKFCFIFNCDIKQFAMLLKTFFNSRLY